MKHRAVAAPVHSGRWQPCSCALPCVAATQSARSRQPVVDWVRKWSAADVQGWLRASRLGHLAPAFAGVDGEVRIQLTTGWPRTPMF